MYIGQRVNFGGHVTQNLHNHTLFSDGSFLPEEIIRQAINDHLELIGISDHFFTTKICHGISYSQWKHEFWSKYLHCIDSLKDYYKKEICVLRGIEIDSCLERSLEKLEMFPWDDINNRLDYVLLEYVGEEKVGGLAIEKLGQLRDFCSIPIILAHSDIDFLQRALPLEAFFDILRGYDIALEIPSGIRNEWFWDHNDPELLRGLKLSIGTDTHSQISEVGNIDRGYEFLKKNNLVEQLLKFI